MCNKQTARTGGESLKPRRFPPILINIIHTALHSCDGVRFHAGSTCLTCGGELSGYDERKKRFAVLIEKDREIPIQVILQRSYCRACKKIINPPSPFYPGTRAGSPVVDLCRSFSASMPYARTSSYLARLGVKTDRWSVRHYAMAHVPKMPSLQVFGMTVPVSIITLSSLAGSVAGTARLEMADVLDACNYPSQAPRPPLQQK